MNLIKSYGVLRARELEGALRLSQLSALSLLEMSSSESLGVEHGEPLSTSSNLRFRPRDNTVSMETRRLGALQTGVSFVQRTDRGVCIDSRMNIDVHTGTED